MGNDRFYERRAAEELAAAERSITPAARLRHQQFADAFLEQLRSLRGHATVTDPYQHCFMDTLVVGEPRA
jgi:hypothetical protein